ncbi:Metalloenzyme, LuxS/M16 peptidase-like protein [Dipodascopsis uninucleata]
MVQNFSTTGGASLSSAMSSGMLSVVASQLERPELDNRSYKVIKLSNELEALLIHDPDTDKASAALDVHVGSYADPPELQGLAHFCEHLLFMGTKKYPKENDYSEYLAAHSGHSNAYTDTQDTNYFFEVGHEYLEGALDRFAQFFISPLFSVDCKDREIRAVDSENKKNLQSDVWRLHQIDRSLSNPNHPYSNFSTGNINTLSTIPSSQGIDVRNELLKFHERFYSANIMKLVILGREPLEQLEQWAVEKFSAVRNSGIAAPKFEESPLTQRELKKQIFAKPVMDEHALELTFLFPDQRALYKSHPGHYYSHLIGHEGPGSILNYLKKKSWANGLSAGASHVSDGTEFFNISVELTTEGLKNYDKVLVTVFQYLRMLQKTPPQEWIFEELKEVAAASFRFRQKSPASSTTSRLAATMQKPLPREWLLSGPTLYREFDEKEIARSAEYFDPDRFRFTLISKEVPGGFDKTEKWYGTEYRVEDIDTNLIDAVKNAPTNEELHLPAKNNFIATDFEVDKKDVSSPSRNPSLIYDTFGCKLWYKKDDTFWVPKANIYIAFRNPLATITPSNSVKTRLFVDLVCDSLNAFTYAANIAGLNFRLGMVQDGLYIGTDGYNHKILILLKTILEEIKNFKVDPERFEVIREKLEREYKNFDYAVPYQQIGFYTSYLLSERSWLNEEKIMELNSVTSKDLEAFIPDLLRQFDTEILVHGNLGKDDASNIAKMVNDTLKHRPLPQSLDVLARSLILPSKSGFSFKRSNRDEKNINSCIEYFCQVGDITNKRQRVTLALLAQIANEPAFNQLRTKEQLGYVVFSGVRHTRTTTGFRVLIQSEKPTDYLAARIDAFFDSLYNIINEMPDNEFQDHVKSLITKRKEKLKNLGEETSRYWNHIQSGYYDYFRSYDEVDILATITKDEVKDLFQSYVHPTSNSRSLMLVELQSQCAKDLPSLQDLLKSHISDYWKQTELAADKQPSDAELDESVASADPKRALKELFNKIDNGLWEKSGESFVNEQIGLSTVPERPEFCKDIGNISQFKSSLHVSSAPLPISDLSAFKKPDPKL